jgi:hypothetical protein
LAVAVAVAIQLEPAQPKQEDQAVEPEAIVFLL